MRVLRVPREIRAEFAFCVRRVLHGLGGTCALPDSRADLRKCCDNPDLNNLAVGGAIASAMVGTSALIQGLGRGLPMRTAIKPALLYCPLA